MSKMSLVDDVENNICLDEKKCKNLLSLQLSEIEMLQSIFSKPGELVIDNNVINAVNQYVNNVTNCIPTIINFTITLETSDSKLEILISFPHAYPTVKPYFHINCGIISKQKYSELMKDLGNHISDLIGESCIYCVVTWLQENIAKYCSSKKEMIEKCSENSDKIFSRFWIYSHHIYNKEKRKRILQLSQSYSISGFCLPGKPGIICIEGCEDDCNNWWHTIKSMTWKKIVCRNKEDIKVTSDINYESLRKFTGFCELDFSVSKIHMDMGKLYSYLEEHNCAHVFKDYFGFEGKH